MPHTTLIGKIAPTLPALLHPGGDGQDPYPLILPMFQAVQLPPGMAQEMAEELGLPSSDIATQFLEALFHTIETVGGHTLIDTAELADLSAAAAANEYKRNEVKIFHGQRCGKPLFRAMVTDFNTDQPRVPCAVMDHDCTRAAR